MVNERRQLLKQSLWLGGLGLLAPMTKAAEVCVNTPAQTSGPFYPGEAKFTTTHDLTRVPGKIQRAEGRIIHLSGRVINGLCQPLVGANVEIWQACASGRYNNPNDPNPAPLDENFAYWGEAFTDQEGKFYFKTIQPGAYQADSDWKRPPHIHFRVSKLGYRELTTQMYFAGDPLNEKDLILQDTPADQRDQLVVNFVEGWGPDGSEGGLGEFTLIMVPVRRS